jgi:hypothetical protein
VHGFTIVMWFQPIVGARQVAITFTKEVQMNISMEDKYDSLPLLLLEVISKMVD